MDYLSHELENLFARADAAIEQAVVLAAENESWRHMVHRNLKWLSTLARFTPSDRPISSLASLSTDQQD
jgi:hypothetical protein